MLITKGKTEWEELCQLPEYLLKKPGFDVEAKHIQTDLTENLGIRGIEELRLLHRYDVEGLSQKNKKMRTA